MAVRENDIPKELVINLDQTASTVYSQIPVTCRKLSSCSCVDERNRIVNLTSLASKGSPRFKDYPTAGGENNLYSWNPCYNFNEGPENEGCIKVGACKISPEGVYTGIGQSETVEFSHDDNGNLSLVMTHGNGHSRTETHVVLYCDSTVDARFRVIGKVSEGIYWLQLWSKYNCPQETGNDVITMPIPNMQTGHMTMPTMPNPGAMTAEPSPDNKAFKDIEILLLCILIMVALILLVLLTRYSVQLVSSAKPQHNGYSLLPQYSYKEKKNNY